MNLRRVSILAVLAIGFALLSRIGYVPSVPFICILVMRLFRVCDCANSRRVWIAFAILGLALYPTALGFTNLDVYAFGYDNIPLIALLAAGAVVLLAFGHSAGLLLSATLLAAALRLHPSPNLWDYLIDPVFFLYCLFQLGIGGRKWSGNQPSPDSTPSTAALPSEQ